MDTKDMTDAEVIIALVEQLTQLRTELKQEKQKASWANDVMETACVENDCLTKQLERAKEDAEARVYKLAELKQQVKHLYELLEHLLAEAELRGDEVSVQQLKCELEGK